MQLAVIFSAASLILCIFSFFYLRSYIKRRTSPEELLAEYRSEVQRLIADIDAAADRDSLLVEERIKRVKTLLDDTDKRITVYIRELDRSRSGEALYTSLGRGIRSALGLQTQEQPEANSAANITEPPVSSQPGPLVLPQSAPLVSPSSKPPVPPPLEFPAPPPPEPPLPVKVKGRSRIKQAPAPAEPEAQPPLRIQIVELAAKGLSSEKIASRLHISIAEVELAMSLRAGMNLRLGDQWNINSRQ